MDEKTQIQILISSIIALIVNLSFSITQILREVLKGIPSVAGYEGLHPFVILCFFVTEIAGIYGLLFKILNFGNN